MKYINKFIAIGLGVTLVFTGGNIAQGYFTSSVSQSNIITLIEKFIQIDWKISNVDFLDKSSLPNWLKFIFWLLGITITDKNTLSIELEITPSDAKIIDSNDQDNIITVNGKDLNIDVIGEGQFSGCKILVSAKDGKLLITITSSDQKNFNLSKEQKTMFTLSAKMEGQNLNDYYVYLWLDKNGKLQSEISDNGNESLEVKLIEEDTTNPGDENQEATNPEEDTTKPEDGNQETTNPEEDTTKPGDGNQETTNPEEDTAKPGDGNQDIPNQEEDKVEGENQEVLNPDNIKPEEGSKDINEKIEEKDNAKENNATTIAE